MKVGDRVWVRGEEAVIRFFVKRRPVVIVRFADGREFFAHEHELALVA